MPKSAKSKAETGTLVIPSVRPGKSVKAKPASKTRNTKPKAARSAKAAAAEPISKITDKETKMTVNKKIAGGIDAVLTDAQSKAKQAFEKSSALFGDYAEFAKGNVEALVESGQILAEGLQDVSTNLVAEGRSAFESASAQVKQMAAAKSPTDLFQLQSEMVRKGFDGAVAYGSKNTEAMLKLASEALAPISGRVSLAVEKVRQAAI